MSNNSALRTITVLHPTLPAKAELLNAEFGIAAIVYGATTELVDGEDTKGYIVAFTGTLENLRKYLSAFGSCIVSGAPVDNSWTRMFFGSNN